MEPRGFVGFVGAESMEKVRLSVTAQYGIGATGLQDIALIGHAIRTLA